MGHGARDVTALRKSSGPVRQPSKVPVHKSFCRIVLMLGNVVIGMTILAPAGMLSELAAGLGVGVHDTGLLVTYGAVMLCIGSPVMAWLTTRIDRRLLLVTTLAILAIGQATSALIP